MTWTYAVASLVADPMMQVRYLVGDTRSSDQQVQDEEIGFALAQRPGIYGAAALVCRSLAAQLSREADTVDQNLRTTLSARASAYARRAAAYEAQMSARGGITPYAGGISVADKTVQDANTDRVPPQFDLGMEDNRLPVAPEGNESEEQP
jgi:hypothetical protein